MKRLMGFRFQKPSGEMSRRYGYCEILRAEEEIPAKFSIKSIGECLHIAAKSRFSRYSRHFGLFSVISHAVTIAFIIVNFSLSLSQPAR